MTDDLREKITNLASGRYARDGAERIELALAVAAMVMEECAKTCDNFGWYGFIGERCAAAIRQRAEGLK